jgi:hypothetical protein
MKFLVYSGSEQQSSESCIRFSLSKKHQLQKTLPHTVRMAPYSVRSFRFIETACAPSSGSIGASCRADDEIPNEPIHVSGQSCSRLTVKRCQLNRRLSSGELKFTNILSSAASINFIECVLRKSRGLIFPCSANFSNRG